MERQANISESQGFLKRMVVSTINERQVESNRISRLLHDEVGQVLSAVGLMLDVMRLDFAGQVPELTDRVQEVQKILDKAVQQVRSLSYDLNPSVVERAGLHMALDRLVARSREVFPGSIRYSFDSSVRVPAHVGNAWYRIAEVALDNSIRHADASRIEFNIKRGLKSVSLEIRDNGKGFSPSETEESPKGLGLLLIEHQSLLAPIRVHVKSTPGKGTSVRSTFALEKSGIL